MKKLIFILTISIILISCGGSGNGELIGIQKRAVWNPVDPYGMVFIPQGSFVMGPSDQDVPFANITASKTVSVGAFYMDETEITNNEYRQFTFWVRDSLARLRLALEYPEDYSVDVDRFDNPIETWYDEARLNWDEKIRWNDEEIRQMMTLEDLYLTPDERFNGKREFDTRKFIYKYQTLDLKSASKKSLRENGGEFEKDRNRLINRENNVHIYPDTLVWTHDYAYSFNEPFTQNYFHHPAFDDYPVVGVSWKQAQAFVNWRTKIMTQYLRNNKEPLLPEFRLPTESEWEYAARGGLALSPYPWGGPYTRNTKGCFLANFKPIRGNYVADGGIKTIKVMSYNPNGYGLYDMAGNVAEWTSNAFDESAFSYAHDMNMDYHYDAQDNDPPVLKRKVIRGGSWKDISFFVQNSTRSYEYQDTSKSYVGFRCAVDFLGRDKKDFK